MIPVIVFYLHILGFTTGFTREYQKEGLSAGFLNLGFMVLIFAVGWSIATFFLKYLISEKGFSIWMDRDALSLLLLTLGEGIFYYLYYRDTEKSIPDK
jgi:hypothetical protein